MLLGRNDNVLSGKSTTLFFSDRTLSFLPTNVTTETVKHLTLFHSIMGTYHACSAQMGSISATYTMAPRPLRAEQQPLPTCQDNTTIQVLLLFFFFFWGGGGGGIRHEKNLSAGRCFHKKQFAQTNFHPPPPPPLPKKSNKITKGLNIIKGTFKHISHYQKISHHYLTISTNKNLLAAKHHICGSL